MSINNPGENNFEKKLEINEILENLKNETKIDVEDILKFQEYKKDLEKIIPELIKIGLIIEEDGSLNFENLKGYRFWPKINGKNLKNFPNSAFNKKYNFGNQNGKIISKKELAKLFKFLGFSVNKNNIIEVEKKIFKDFEEEKNFYKYELEKIIPELQKIGLKIEKDGSLNFSILTIDWMKIKINGKNLISFPNTTFNKKYNFGNQNGQLKNKKDLEKLFKFLGFSVNKDIFGDKKEDYDNENYILEVEDLNDIINFSNFDPDNFSLKKEDF